MNKKVIIVGVGNVGASYAYALLNQRTFVNELILIDTDFDKALGEAMDLNHSLAFAPSKIKIRVGDYSDVKDAKIVCITAGLNQKPGESRRDLVKANEKIIQDIVQKVMKYDFRGIFLVATNPVDAMCKVVLKSSKVASNLIIGSGTSLDTSRLRFLIGEKLEINPKNVHAYVIGEHGDSEFVPWSNATIGLNSINNYLSCEDLEKIYLEVKNSAYEIIAKKGFTNFGIGVCLVKITNAILGNENTILTISSYNKDQDIFISSPTIIHHNGVKNVLNLNLSTEESELFLQSIREIQKLN